MQLVAALVALEVIPARAAISIQSSKKIFACFPGTALPCFSSVSAQDVAGHIHRLLVLRLLRRFGRRGKSKSCLAVFDHQLSPIPPPRPDGSTLLEKPCTLQQPGVARHGATSAAMLGEVAVAAAG